MSNIKVATVTGNFEAAGAVFGYLALSGDTTAAKAVLRDGGSGGTIVGQITCVASSMEGLWPAGGFINFSGQPHVTLTGTGAVLNYEMA